MMKKSNRDKILQVFFDDPLASGGFQLREISRLVDVAPVSVKRYLDELVREKIVIRRKNRVQGYPTYHANRDDEGFRFTKKLENIRAIKESGLLDLLENEYMPQVIILFGSASKGEDTAESDIDLFLLCKEKKQDLKKYESGLRRKINLFFCKDFGKLSIEFKNNIINGIILKGYLDLQKIE